MKLAVMEKLLGASRTRDGLALITELSTGAQQLLARHENFGQLELNDQEREQIWRAIEEDSSRTITTPRGELFVEVWSASLRLIVIGGVHTAQSLVPLAKLVGYEVSLIDPRSAFASESRFPNTTRIVEWPEFAVPKLEPDRWTALVTLTHNARIDDSALVAALRSEAFYIGALGSRRTHEQRCLRLREQGFELAQLSRIRGPIGLAIGALTPNEIALSIMAEIIAVKRRSRLAARA